MVLYIIGDSLSFGLTCPPGKRFTRIFGDRTRATIRNFGEPGDTTSGMLVRLISEISPKIKKDISSGEDVKVLIMGGSNDIIYSGSSVCAKTNLGAMVHHLLCRGIVPYIGIPVPLSSELIPEEWKVLVTSGEFERIQADYRKWIYDFCGIFNVPVVDMSLPFFDDNGEVISGLYSDGAHPNEEGHAQMAEVLLGTFTY